MISLGVHELVYTYVGKGTAQAADIEADFADTHDEVPPVVQKSSARRKQV